MNHLMNFVEESNKIEGILRTPLLKELNAHEQFLQSQASVIDLQMFVNVIAPDHVIRDRIGFDVRVGSHIAPAGGPKIIPALDAILKDKLVFSPYAIHCQYLNLHPFTDGNGRSARVLWLWMMQKAGKDRIANKYGFLHAFYYQTLDNFDARMKFGDS